MEYRPAAALIPFAKNARTHSDAQVPQIAASIREFGWPNPILIDGKQPRVIAGHGMAAGGGKAGDRASRLTEAQKRAYIAARQQAGAECRLGQRTAGADLRARAGIGPFTDVRVHGY